MKHLLHFFALTFLLFGVSMTGNAQNALLTNPTTGNITSQTAIYDFDFIYDGTDLVLALVGYTTPTSYIYFTDWNASDATNVHDWTSNNVADIKTTFAGMIGDSPANIETWNMEVNPKTQAVYILFFSTSANQTFLVEVKNSSTISIVDLTSVTYSAVEYSDVSDYMMDVQVGSGQKLYGSVIDDQQTLDAHVGVFEPPFAHNSLMDARPTTVFKSNWGGMYVTWAPLEQICFANVDGTERLMGVTTCAPGFSIPVSEIYSSASVLQVTEDFNVRNDPSKKVVALTHTDGTETTTYLYDLHDNWSIPSQLIRIGEKYLDGSRVTAGEFNLPAQELRTFGGQVTSGLTPEEVMIVSEGYEMIAKYTNESHLMVIDDNDVLRLLDVTSPTVGVDSESASEELFTVFPNPTTASIQITAPDLALQRLVVRIHDVAGKLIQEEQLAPGSRNIDLSALDAGTYTVSVLDVDFERIGTQQVVKQ